MICWVDGYDMSGVADSVSYKEELKTLKSAAHRLNIELSRYQAKFRPLDQDSQVRGKTDTEFEGSYSNITILYTTEISWLKIGIDVVDYLVKLVKDIQIMFNIDDN